MLDLQLWKRGGAVAVMALVATALCASNASAKTVYAWVTEDGTHAYTDDQKRIPDRYKPGVERKTLRRLKDYPRYTPMPKEGVAHGQRQLERATAMREGEASTEYPVVALGPGHELLLNLPLSGGRDGQGSGLSVPVSGMSDEALVVERRRVRVDGSNATRTITVVKQGDRVVAVVKPKRNEGPIAEMDEDEVY